MRRKDKSVDHIFSKCSKLAQKEFKSMVDWVGKVIHWKLFKRLEFDQANEKYMHKPECILKNATYKTSSDFDIQTDPLITS